MITPAAGGTESTNASGRSAGSDIAGHTAMGRAPTSTTQGRSTTAARWANGWSPDPYSPSPSWFPFTITFSTSGNSRRTASAPVRASWGHDRRGCLRSPPNTHGHPRSREYWSVCRRAERPSSSLSAPAVWLSARWAWTWRSAVKMIFIT